MGKQDANAQQRELLLRMLDDAYGGPAWHGPHLRGTIRRVTPAQATWRPAPGRRNIAEITVHCAYWKYAVRRRLSAGKRGSFALTGSNWFEQPERLTKGQWSEYAALLDNEHAALVRTVESASWAQICRAAKGDTKRGRGHLPAPHVYGAALHDVYHAGQIQTIKALYKQGRQ